MTKDPASGPWGKSEPGMSAVRMRARADLRSRPASVAVLALAFGLAGAVALTSLAGARRTGSAYSRYRKATREPEAFVFSVLLVVPVTIAVAVLVALGPALVARRTRPALVLRAE